MPTLQEVLQSLSAAKSSGGAPAYGAEVPRYNAFEQAPAMANAIVQFQKEQRANPYVQALQDYSKQWQAAGTDEERQKANAAANLARASFLSAGGSPMDLPNNLWGSDPTQGFQTGLFDFIPAYTGDSLSIGQRERQAELKRQTEAADLTKRQWDASAEAQDWYLPLTKQTMEANIANILRSAKAPYSSGSSGGGSSGLTPYQQWQVGRKDIEDQQKLMDDARALATNDPRLWGYGSEPEEGYFTLPQLIDAWYKELSQRLNEQGSSSVITDEELLQYIK